MFRSTGCQHYLRLAFKARNKITAMIDRAKSNYFKNVLNDNAKNPKKFWQILKGFTDNNPRNRNISNFVDPVTNAEYSNSDTADFLNSYFVNIVERLNITNPDNT